MPELDGCSLSERMRTANPALKVLFLSGYPSDTLAHTGALNGHAAFLQKPFTTGALATKVREVLDRKG